MQCAADTGAPDPPIATAGVALHTDPVPKRARAAPTPDTGAGARPTGHADKAVGAGPLLPGGRNSTGRGAP